MKNIYPLKHLEIPLDVVERDGPFAEFKQNASIVTITLNNGTEIDGVLLLYPNYIIAIDGEAELPFSPSNVVKVAQTEKDLIKRPVSGWSYFYNPEEFNEDGQQSV